jgi:hypothetical protein
MMVSTKVDFFEGFTRWTARLSRNITGMRSSAAIQTGIKLVSLWDVSSALNFCQYRSPATSSVKDKATDWLSAGRMTVMFKAVRLRPNLSWC